jgi:hypothetical protein
MRTHLREFSYGRTITAMLELRHTAAPKLRVNVLKRVKVNGQWKLCPAVIEANGRLRDRIRINGHTENHPEGVYYIEWRDKGQRRRQAIPNRNEVLEQARLKALELEADKAGMKTSFLSPSLQPTNPTPPVTFPIATNGPKPSNAAEVIPAGPYQLCRAFSACGPRCTS